MNIKEENICKILEVLGARVELVDFDKHHQLKLSSKAVAYLSQQMEEMEMLEEPDIEPLGFLSLSGTVGFKFLGQQHFNRYRNITLRSALYDEYQSFPLQNVRRFCRSHEKECLRGGLHRGVWTNREAEKVFGKAADSGDFFGNGASGWKLQAYKDFVWDLLAYENGVNVIYLCEYDQVMSKGKLIRLGDMLLTPQSVENEILINFLSRKFNIEREKGEDQTKEM